MIRNRVTRGALLLGSLIVSLTACAGSPQQALRPVQAPTQTQMPSPVPTPSPLPTVGADGGPWTPRADGSNPNFPDPNQTTDDGSSWDHPHTTAWYCESPDHILQFQKDYPTLGLWCPPQ